MDKTAASSPATATRTVPSALIFPTCSNTATNRVHQAAKETMGSQASAALPAEEAVRDLLAREILHIQNRLQQQEYSVQFIQGEVANLSNRVAQIGISLGMQHIQDGTILSQASCFAIQQDVQFSEMPIWDVNDEETDGYLSKEISSPPSPMSATATDQTQFQTFEKMPVFDVYDDEMEGCSTEFADVFVGIPEQQKYEDQQDNEKLATCFHKTSENVFSEQLLRDFSKAPQIEQTRDDIWDYTFDLQHQNDEKASAKVQQLRDPQLIVLVIHERRREWDPGALLPLRSSKAQHSRQALQPAPFSQVFQFGVPTHVSRYIKITHGQCIREILGFDLAPGYALGNVQHLEAYKWKSEAGRKEWDPGDTTFHVLFTTADSATKLKCADVYKSAIVQILAEQFDARRAPGFKSDSMCSDSFGLGCLEVNASALFGLVALCSTVTSCSLPSSENRAKLQWDPGIAISAYMYTRKETREVKALTWLKSPLLSDLQYQLQVSKTFYVWDPGTLSILDMMLGTTVVQTPFKQLNFIEQPIHLKQFQDKLLLHCHFWCNAAYCCRIFQRCTTLSSLFHCQGIPLWLINFQVP